MSENVEAIDFYFVCIFNFIKYNTITKIKSKDNSIDIEFKEINNPEENTYKTYLMYSKLNFNKNVTIQIEYYENKEDKNKIKTFESKIDFENNRSKFLYEINYKSSGFFSQNHDGIKQDNHNFFKFKEFIKFINNFEEKKRENLKQSLIEDSIKNFEHLKTKNENEFEFFYLLLLMKETNSKINFSFEEIKSKKFIFPENINYIENIEDYKNYLLDNNFKNNDDNYKIIKFIFLWMYFKEDFINEFTKEKFDYNYKILSQHFSYFKKIKLIEINNSFNKILYKCSNEQQLNTLLNFFFHINEQIEFIIKEKKFINKNFKGKKIIFNKSINDNIINVDKMKIFLNLLFSFLIECPNIQFEIKENSNEYDFLKESFKINQFNIKFLLELREILKK